MRVFFLFGIVFHFSCCVLEADPIESPTFQLSCWEVPGELWGRLTSVQGRRLFFLADQYHFCHSRRILNRVRGTIRKHVAYRLAYQGAQRHLLQHSTPDFCWSGEIFNSTFKSRSILCHHIVSWRIHTLLLLHRLAKDSYQLPTVI